MFELSIWDMIDIQYFLLSCLKFYKYQLIR